MKSYIFNFACLLLICSGMYAQFPVHVREIKAIPNQTLTVKGNLNQGAPMEDLTWAWNSSVACFPATQKQKFTGNHVLYHTVIPSRAIMTITVIPDNKNANFSLYAYQIGTSNFSTVPNLTTCLACEADHKWDYPKVNKTQDHSRTVELNTLDDPFNVVIGVVGADGLNDGMFTLNIKLEGGEETMTLNQAPVKVNAINTEKNRTITVKGDLKEGVIIHDLSWAWKSSVACFPGTQATKFRGNHVIYSAELPDNSIMDITLIPDDKKADFSLYAYQIGLSNNSIVPNLSSCVSCEADHKWDYPKANKTQDHTRKVSDFTAMNSAYKIIIGVAGSNGLTEGSYVLKIEIRDRM